LAVKEGEPQPEVGSDELLKVAFHEAESIGFSTGPSGTHLLEVLARWGIADALAQRLVKAPPGVPVGELITSGRAALGFQQVSELMFHPGVQLLGPLAPSIQLRTTFSAATGSKSDKAQSARAFLQFCTSSGVAALKSSQGMIAP
jgi:molybdate transport system substrate-binding protein